MIRHFTHKGLRKLFEEGDSKAIQPMYVDKIRRILLKLDTSDTPADMNLPGYKLHALSGDRKGYWSVTVSANWRIIFRFDGNDATKVDLIDYH